MTVSTCRCYTDKKWSWGGNFIFTHSCIEHRCSYKISSTDCEQNHHWEDHAFPHPLVSWGSPEPHMPLCIFLCLLSPISMPSTREHSGAKFGFSLFFSFFQKLQFWIKMGAHASRITCGCSCDTGSFMMQIRYFWEQTHTQQDYRKHAFAVYSSSNSRHLVSFGTSLCSLAHLCIPAHRILREGRGSSWF